MLVRPLRKERLTMPGLLSRERSCSAVKRLKEEMFVRLSPSRWSVFRAVKLVTRLALVSGLLAAHNASRFHPRTGDRSLTLQLPKSSLFRRGICDAKVMLLRPVEAA